MADGLQVDADPPSPGERVQGKPVRVRAVELNPWVTGGAGELRFAARTVAEVDVAWCTVHIAGEEEPQDTSGHLDPAAVGGTVTVDVALEGALPAVCTSSGMAAITKADRVAPERRPARATAGCCEQVERPVLRVERQQLDLAQRASVGLERDVLAEPPQLSLELDEHGTQRLQVCRRRRVRDVEVVREPRRAVRDRRIPADHDELDAPLGEVAKDRLVLTSGAQDGDDLLLTKGIAVEGTAILAREREGVLRSRGYPEACIERAQRYLYDPGISVVREALVAVETASVSAMHDPTEGGLSGGLYELSEAAGVGLEVNQAAIPILDETATLCQEFHLDPLGLIASGALLITCRPKDTDRLIGAVRATGVVIHRIGRVLPQARGVILIGPAGEKPLPAFERDEIVKIFDA